MSSPEKSNSASTPSPLPAPVVEGERGDASALIARLEKATGPDRALDCLIYATLSWPRGNWEIAQVACDSFCEPHFTWSVLRRTTESSIVILAREVPHYTSAVNPWLGGESMSRVASPQIASVVLLGDGRFEARALDEAGNYHVGEGATEPIARLIAHLKARAALAKARAA